MFIFIEFFLVKNNLIRQNSEFVVDKQYKVVVHSTYTYKEKCKYIHVSNFLGGQDLQVRWVGDPRSNDWAATGLRRYSIAFFSG